MRWRVPGWIELVVSLNLTFILGVLLLKAGLSLAAVGYVVMMVPPVMAFGLDRLMRRAELTPFQIVIDVLVFVASAARLLFPMLPYSGHVLMLLFACITCRRSTALATALVGLIGSLVIKFGWMDFVTSLGGVLLGGLLALLWLRLAPRSSASQLPENENSSVAA